VDSALYFPYIRVPENSWFTQVLLYWDDVATIVPGAFNFEIGSYTYELHNAGLLEYVRPQDAIWADDVNFGDNFLELLDTYAHVSSSARRIPSVRVHKFKGPSSLFAELKRRGLAISQGEWWLMEPRIAGLYMAYLVGSICRIYPAFSPVTDSARNLATLVSAADDAAARIRELSYDTTIRALPVPSRPIPPEELASFKEAHGDQLRRLRTYINAKVADLAAIDDRDIRQAKAGMVIQEMSDEVAALREQMSRRSWPRIILLGMSGVFGSALSLGATAVNPAAALALGLGITGGILSLSSSLYQANEVYRDHRLDPRAPLAYAALAQEL
jgi:hypothetical protein